MPTPTFATSYSAASTYLQCGEQYRLSRVEKVPERQAVYLAGGKAFHTASELIDNSVYQREDDVTEADWNELTALAYDQFVAEFDAEVEAARLVEPDVSLWLTAGRRTKAQPNKETVDVWRTLGATLVVNYIGWRRAHPTLQLAVVDGRVGIEWEFWAEIGGNTRHGFIDRLFEDTNTGDLLVVDLKTGARPPDKPMQLTTYRDAVNAAGRDLFWGAFWMARRTPGNQPAAVDLTGEDVSHVFAQVDRGIAAGVFTPKPSRDGKGWPCGNCLQRNSCSYVDQGVKAA